MANANACEASTSTDEEMSGEDNMWCQLLCAAYHYYIWKMPGPVHVLQQQSKRVRNLPFRGLHQPDRAGID